MPNQASRRANAASACADIFCDGAMRDSEIPQLDGRCNSSIAAAAFRSIRPLHVKQGFGANFEVVAPASRTHDRMRKGDLVDDVLDDGLVDVRGQNLAWRQPSLRWPPSTLFIRMVCETLHSKETDVARGRRSYRRTQRICQMSRQK